MKQTPVSKRPGRSPAPEFKVGDHVVATTGATDNCPATGIICNIGKGWYVITLDQPEAFPSVKSGKISARAGSMALYVPKVVEEPAPAAIVTSKPAPAAIVTPARKSSAKEYDDDDEDQDDEDEDQDDEESDDEGDAGCQMARQLAAARVRYSKTKRPNGSASADCADAIAKALRDYEPLEVCEIADKVFKLPLGSHEAKYSKLNPGQKRMNSGNRIRAYWKKLWEADNRTEIARVADLVGVVLADDFMAEDTDSGVA